MLNDSLRKYIMLFEMILSCVKWALKVHYHLKEVVCRYAWRAGNFYVHSSPLLSHFVRQVVSRPQTKSRNAEEKSRPCGVLEDPFNYVEGLVRPSEEWRNKRTRGLFELLRLPL